MKRSTLFIICTTALLLVVGIVIAALLFNDATKEAKLETGLYFIEARGALFVSEREDVTLPLLVYYYNNGKSDDSEIIEQYTDFALLTDEGEEIPFEVPGDILSGFKFGDDARIKQNEIPVTIGHDAIHNESITITGLKYSDEKKQINEVDIGKIDICRKANTYESVKVFARRIVFAKFVLPTIRQYSVFVENPSDEDMIVNSIDFGETGLVSKEIDFLVKPADESSEVVFDVTENNQEGCYIYYLKPAFNIVTANKPLVVIQSNISSQRYIGDGDVLFDYFANK